MKIIYSAGNRIGAGIQAQRCVEALTKAGHQVLVAAYNYSFRYLEYIHWCLNAISNKSNSYRATGKLFDHPGAPSVNIENTEYLIEDVSSFDPNLIISDGEPVIAHVADTLGIRLWYCSPLHLEDGLDWGYGEKKIFPLLENTRKMLQKLPKAEKKIIYSPFCAWELPIKCDFEMVTPYHSQLFNENAKNNLAIIIDSQREEELKKILVSTKRNVVCCCPDKTNNCKDDIFSSNTVFLLGDTSYLSDCLYSKKNIILAPSNNDVEALLNSTMIEKFGLGLNLAQVELAGKEAKNQISESFKFDSAINVPELYIPFLHEIIENDR
jgi:hypothetical protein